MGILYFLIVLAATTVGAIAGVGGGVLIKPILDALAHYSVDTIGVLSSMAVLSMAVVSTGRRLVMGLKIDRKIVLLAVGAIAGGFVGKETFSFLLTVTHGSVMKIIQSMMIVLLMVMILFKNGLPKYRIENLFGVFTIGVILGTLAAFLGIGGGPVNVAVLYLFLNMDIKKAAVGSIFIILLAQTSKIATISLSEGLGAYDIKMLWYMIPAGITGGVLGSIIHNRIKEKTIHVIFDITVVLVILICLYNIVLAAL